MKTLSPLRASLRPGVIALAMILATSVTQAETIHEAMFNRAPALLKQLHDKGYQTIGVLKFRVQKPGEKTSDSVGPLNSLLADRLEIAMILANPFGDEQLDIIKDASSQAVQIDGASHLTKEGRTKFFGPEFELAWSDRRLAADAFLTGLVQLNAGESTANVALLYFDRNGSGLERIGDVFEVQLDATTVTELGESFVLRGAFDDGETSVRRDSSTPNNSNPNTVNQDTTADNSNAEIVRRNRDERVVEESKRVKSQLTVFPLQDKGAPVTLEVKYDGRVMPVEIRNGQAFLPEPRQGQKVEFVLNRASFVQGTLGVVLKVNGENTLYRQTVRDVDCSKWLLTPDYTRTVIRGYQMPDSNTLEAFTVLSARESARRAVDYGRQVGQVQLTVFKQSNDDTPPPVVTAEDEDLLAMLRGVHPSDRSDSLDLLKTRIRHAANEPDQLRSLIVPGEQEANEIEILKFTPDPTPIMSVTLTYYTP
ncbi:MAG: hypothetical protein KDA91_09750 [Planctomycetaceae bacterium]|nr:hypothetical protein [Planctomycetaceae bacterium]